MSNVGRMIYGFCNGYFGRDSYRDKRIEAEGVDWLVARGLDEDDEPEFAHFEYRSHKQEMIDEWSTRGEE